MDHAAIDNLIRIALLREPAPRDERIAAMKLLDWLAKQAVLADVKPLRARLDQPWGTALQHLLCATNGTDPVFSMDEAGVVAIDDRRRAAVVAYVRVHYRPPIILD